MSLTETDYRSALALLIECEQKQDSSIQHEWLMNSRADAVKFANYLRSCGYTVENKVRHPLGIEMFYVGVPFKSLKP